MSRNEIRIRKNRVSPGDIARHRNYGKLMRRHDRYLKMKRSIIALVYFLIITLMILVYMLTKRAEQKKATPAPQEKAVQTVHCAPPTRTGVATIE
ncbi:hypothetical protein KK062_22680 [Fulvivirgaceae bacterium PWU5]|uniref:Uncharacterized protein n=1 Tax=Dawidia cretensis TaxID=2782350 RepID=A0AAP2E104_9BACT|nr:hypothetical protein [Dawidia cretensis]MBT1711066.1 hypothetical protein [Dawidia cretensis]